MFEVDAVLRKSLMARKAKHAEDLVQSLEEAKQAELHARVGGMTLQAAIIAERNSIRTDRKHKIINYQTGWADLVFDVINDEIQQYALNSQETITSRLPRRTEVDWVDLDTRLANLDKAVTSPVKRVAVFDSETGTIKAPVEGKTFPDGELVLPGTPAWQKLDIILRQMGYTPFSGSTD